MTLDNINPSLPRPTQIQPVVPAPVRTPITNKGQLLPPNDGVVVSISKQALQRHKAQ
jgi:hypothetical protein